MKCIFVCEFITCGGMRNRELPCSLLADAERMYQALLSDLRQIDDLDIVTCRDDRLSGVLESVASITQGDDAWKYWRRCMETADLAWLIAPETDGVLLRLNKMARQSACELIACDDDTVELTTSKYATNKYLLEQGIPALMSLRLDDEWLSDDRASVVKPDNGAGSEQCYFFQNSAEMLSWKNSREAGSQYIQQPYLPGISASLSVLYARQYTRLLACNRQMVGLRQGMLVNEGIIVNGLQEYFAPLEALAVEIGKKLLGLRGYVGIDLVLGESEITVIEINPRLTTAYAGLSEALNTNVAELVINTLQRENQGSFYDNNTIHAGV